MSSDRLTFKSFKKEKVDNNMKPSPSFPVRQPPKQSILRLSKLAFPFAVLANLALSAYIFVRAKQKDESTGLRSKWRKSPPITSSPASIVLDPSYSNNEELK